VALAPWVVPVVWGAKWLAAVPVLAVLGLQGVVAPLPNLLYPYFVSSKRISLLLRLSLVRLLAYVVLFTPVATLGDLRLAAVAHMALMLGSTAALVTLAWPRLGARLSELGPAVAWPLLRAAACGLAAALVARVLDPGLPPLAVLAAAAAAGGSVYAGLLWITDRDGFDEAASVFARGSGVLHVAR
jgi:PST family polysaccharide transporter